MAAGLLHRVRNQIREASALQVSALLQGLLGTPSEGCRGEYLAAAEKLCNRYGGRAD